MRDLLSNALTLLCLCAMAALVYLNRNTLLEDPIPYLGRDATISEIRVAQRQFIAPGLKKAGFAFGAPAYIRIFKEEAELELWLKRGGTYALWKAYPICSFSGDLGPKLREGDRQSPEGFYTVGLSALNPNSSYHLSFNLGFPNPYDRARSRTGSFLMVHGDCLSIGCYAMTDPAIEQIYVMVEAALRSGQRTVPVHAFPFRMTRARLAAEADYQWYGFWRELQPAYLEFERTRIPPEIRQSGGRYLIQ
ncbi:MAG: murein L,D-transpeptidase family protein [Pseudomonadota bacterium]